MAAPVPSRSLAREQILSRLQEITSLNIEDAIHFLDQYNWNLDDVINDYYSGIELEQKLSHNPSLGRFYSTGNDNEQHDEDSDRHYAQLLQLYGDADQWARTQQTQERLEPHRPIYHERQRLMRCGLHSLNNLFQMPKLFTTRNLESIVREYDKRKLFNDYRTLWFGNYDLRILIEAINRCGFDVRQVDMYRSEALGQLPWDSYFGLLINLNGAHWFTIKNLNGIYYNLDSTLRKPIEIGQREHLIHYLHHLISRTRTVYLFVVSQQFGESRAPSLPLA